MPTGDRLRIAFVSDNFGMQTTGGVVSARRFVDRLRQRGHEVILVGADVQGPDSIRMPRLDAPIRAMRDMGFVMARPNRALLAEACARADVVHLQMPFWLSVAALGEARRARLPVVAGFHVQPENLFLNVGVRSKWLNRLTYWVWIRSLYGRVDSVVAPSDFAARKLQEHGLERPITVITNGAPESLTERPVRERRPDDDGGPIRILTVGRLSAEKDHRTLIAAVRQSRYRDRIELVIAGKGPMEQQLKALSSDLPRVQVGYVPEARLVEIRETSDLYVHTSEVELEGMAVVEAMSVGLPVLVADGPETAASAFALDERFRFPVGNVGALAAQLDALLDHRSELHAFGEIYRQEARQLDFDRSVRKLEAVYRTAIRQLHGQAAPRLLSGGVT